ncbi:hypothetical protein [Candidatus Nitrosotenuis uzonensis]|uniref:Uncharacterized protein n=1 Tax=Candidatus Nitrosotenuis uzonensis TaxID=1407055 RepID=V6ARF9_9ARCH|nr:hypothetical protein [Candidatus Nitrosotenuis uzonensis]CDI05326.1 conserved hypothetical protein [Candidatus Nitrosotenuis uzonensis]
MAVMVDLNRRVFGSFSFKDVYGETPHLSEIRHKLESEFDSAVGCLGEKNRTQLEFLLEEQTRIKRELDVRAGSMALPQDKLTVFTDIISRYVGAIKAALEKTK